MSEHVDALILIAHASRIVEDVPRYVHEDAEQGLWYITHGKKLWYDGKPITETDRRNLYASEIILKLGRLTASVYQNKPISFIGNVNPLKFKTIDSLREHSPLSGTDTLKLPFEAGKYGSELSHDGLPSVFDAAVTQDPSLFVELTSKWAIAREIHRKRGTVSLLGYDVNELAEGLNNLNMDEIAPVDITGSSYDLSDLIDHADIAAYRTDVPYYATLREQENAAELLGSALDDLKQVKEAIRS